jgi:hypothetical protein
MTNDTSNTTQASHDHGDRESIDGGYCLRCESLTLSLSDLLCPPCQEEGGSEPGDADTLIPYPNLTNPKTGQPFTQSEINAIHRVVADEMEAAAWCVVHEETGWHPPSFWGTSLEIRKAARLCLVDALNVADSGAGH